MNEPSELAKAIAIAIIDDMPDSLRLARMQAVILAELAPLREVVVTLQNALLDARDGQNELHGIKHGGPAKRTLRGIEDQAAKALAKLDAIGGDDE